MPSVRALQSSTFSFPLLMHIANVFSGAHKEDCVASPWWQDQDQVQDQVHPLPIHPLAR